MVQGIGFRPFVFKTAQSLKLTGWIKNYPNGVWIEVEGHPAQLNQFEINLQTDKPSFAIYSSFQSNSIPVQGCKEFQILESIIEGEALSWVSPDYATCPSCFEEIFDPSSRRYHYPFTNCTQCGPRFSILKSLPYDRQNTTMASFAMCDSCKAEYENPKDRRFHAQPNACKDCGPQLELLNREGDLLGEKEDALQKAKTILAEGGILAVKGIGGFSLMARANCEEALQRLRTIKQRNSKPFALMLENLAEVSKLCHISKQEELLLCSVESPIVLLQKKDSPWVQLSPYVAPKNPELGLMLPNNPLQYLLLEKAGPLVATSANLGGQPLCIHIEEALVALRGKVDGFLNHNRPILRRLDDSITRVIQNKTQVLRRARGFCPLPVQLKKQLPPMLAVGGQQKGTVAVSRNQEIFVGQHLGDLENSQAFASFQDSCRDLPALFGVKPESIVADLHPAYESRQFAENQNVNLRLVPHHHAHLGALLAETGFAPPALGLTWDGTGLGEDGVLQGGEAFLVSHQGFSHFATLHPFVLPGGEASIHQPLRIAASLLFATFGPQVFDQSEEYYLGDLSTKELKILPQIITKKINSPETTAMGRLFDGVSAWLGICQQPEYDGQAAMELEFSLDLGQKNTDFYGFGSSNNLDWREMIQGILKDRKENASVHEISLKFHNTLLEWMIRLAQSAGKKDVLLTGGCFQNRYLLEAACSRLQKAGFKPWFPERFPPNDGALSLGQIYIASQSKD